MARFAKFLAAGLVVVIAGVVWKGNQAYRAAADDFVPRATRFVAPSVVDGHETMTLVTKGGLHIAASFVPPKNEVVVLLGHGSESSRVQLWGDLELLAKAGFGVLVLDWPGNGESEGPIKLGTPEREAFTAAVDFLSARPDVKRIGAYGFSQGGGLLTMFVADEPRVTSLLAVNAWSDKVSQMRYGWKRLGEVQELPVEWATRANVEGGNANALAAAPKLKGKKTLFIASCADEVVPPSNSSELATAAAGDLQTATGAS
ncbi:MAG: alpha/beta fold hydrolase, partial [Myxococcaceae bacterium]|nr:alpha/beta fold hydrolase [Myxococcaceae bacterium]